MDTNGARLTFLDYAIITLTLATAAIHFSLVFPSALFILNALGYVGLLAGLYLPIHALAERRDLLRWALIGYTAFTVVAWFFMSDVRTPLAYSTKLIEGVLIVLLVLKGREASA